MSVMQYKAVWPILGLIDSKLRQKIKLAYIFGDGNMVLILTTDDEVYSFGNDVSKFGCLGQGQGVTMLLQPKKIDVLSKKGIHVIAIGSAGHVIAVTTNSEIYAWGYGASYNLGNAATANLFVPAAITANFGGNRISRVTCGSNHTLALTDDGQIYSWGLNNVGQLGQAKRTTQHPEPITSSLGGKFVVDISCTSSSSFAVLDNGELYGWGQNHLGQIGTITTGNNYTEPVQVTSLRTVIIKQIVCGKNYFLALSRSGHIYACGEGTHGQIGNGAVNNVNTAAQLPEKLGSFSQVAATHFSDLSAALSESGEVFVWGFCRFQIVNTPMKTELSSLDDAFACYSSPPVSWRPLPIVTALPLGYRGDVLNSLKNCLQDDEEIKDVTFIVENKKLRAHKTILMIRSTFFRKMFQNDWAERKKEGIYIRDFSYEGYRILIEYIYTGTVTDNLEFNVAVDLLQIADCYQEMKLKFLCEEALKDRIQVDNCAFLYEIAMKFQAKLLRTGCAKFGAHHMTAVIATDHFKQMTNPKVIQDFLIETAQYGAFKY